MFSLNTLRRFMLRKLRDTPIQKLHPELSHSVLVSRATYSPWHDDPAFMKIYNQIRRHTLVDIYRCHELWSLLQQLDAVEGDILEVGVWKGGTGSLIACRNKHLWNKRRHIFLCDTFVGVVKTSNKDTLYQGGEHADTSETEVRQLLNTLSVSDQVTLLRGIFPNETGHHIENQRFAFCHIDVDAYASAKDIFLWIYPRLSQNGIIVFDDYGFYGCEGVTTLVNELKETVPFLFIHNLNGHAVCIKTEMRPESPL